RIASKSPKIITSLSRGKTSPSSAKARNGAQSLETVSKALLALILSCRNGLDAQMESESRWGNYRERVTGKDYATVCPGGTNRVWGAHAPSRADFGASPKCFSKTNQESRWRGANDSTRGVCAPRTSIATITTTRRIETEDFAKHILSQSDDSFSRWEKVRMRALLRNFASSI